MSAEVHEILALVQNPPEYLSWHKREKSEFYENIVKWHEYINDLMKTGEVTIAWGAEKLPGRVRSNPTKTLLIAIYKTTFERFSELITQDPLWDYGWYEAPILKSIEGDYEQDVERVNRQRAYLEKKLGRKLPEVVAEYQGEIPQIEPGGDIEVLVLSRNTPDYEALSEEAKLEQDEKVLQMHSYRKPLREAGIIAKDWGTYQNCGFGIAEGPTVASGAHIVRVNTYDEFDIVFLSDPIRNISYVRTVVLVPFKESWRRALYDLKAARARLSDFA
jgi:hypothetical protein